MPTENRTTQQWEYLEIGAGANIERLNALGKEGWEMVFPLIILGGLTGIIYFKRPLPQSPQ